MFEALYPGACLECFSVLVFGSPLRFCYFWNIRTAEIFGVLPHAAPAYCFTTRFFECPSPCCPGGMLHRLVFSWQSCSMLGLFGSPAPFGGFLVVLQRFGGFSLCLSLAFFASLTVVVFGIPLRLWYFLEYYRTRYFWSASSSRSGGVLHPLALCESFSFWCSLAVPCAGAFSEPSIAWVFGASSLGLVWSASLFCFLEALYCFAVSGILHHLCFLESYTAPPRGCPSPRAPLSVLHPAAPEECFTVWSFPGSPAAFWGLLVVLQHLGVLASVYPWPFLRASPCCFGGSLFRFGIFWTITTPGIFGVLHRAALEEYLTICLLGSASGFGGVLAVLYPGTF